MRKTVYFLTLVSLFILPLSVGTTSYAFVCVGPSGIDCLACHAAAGGGTPGGNPFPNGYLHQNPPHQGLDCSECHCGVASPCPPAWGPVETQCCTSCHDECTEVHAHTNRVENNFYCGQCHYPPMDPGDCAPLCQEYKDKYDCCVDLRDVQGLSVDYDACAGYTNPTTCAANDCYWNEFGTGGGQCVIDICLENGNFDIFIDGDDLNIFKREFGRYDCACMPGVGADLCEKYYNLYTCCLGLSSRNLDYDDCQMADNKTDCEDFGCYWNEFGTGGGQCVIDICLENGNFDIFIDGDDLNIFKREFGGYTCDCAP